jgi:hypothetical protein
MECGNGAGKAAKAGGLLKLPPSTDVSNGVEVFFSLVAS